MTREVHAMLKARNNTFKSSNIVALRTTTANCAITDAKHAHDQKVQDFFHDPMNTRQMWQGIQDITDNKATPPPAKTTSTFSTNSVTTLGGLRHSTSLLQGNLFLALINSHWVWTQLMSGEPWGEWTLGKQRAPTTYQDRCWRNVLTSWLGFSQISSTGWTRLWFHHV